MPNPMNETRDPGIQLKAAIARWDNEGGAGPKVAQRHDGLSETVDGLSAPMPAEMEQLHIRVIALENLMIALLASSNEELRTLARSLAATISPRPGATQHILTIHAARQMLKMVERAEHVMTSEPLKPDEARRRRLE